jgi:hypothetical protein
MIEVMNASGAGPFWSADYFLFAGVREQVELISDRQFEASSFASNALPDGCQTKCCGAASACPSETALGKH